MFVIFDHYCQIYCCSESQENSESSFVGPNKVSVLKSFFEAITCLKVRELKINFPISENTSLSDKTDWVANLKIFSWFSHEIQFGSSQRVITDICTEIRTDLGGVIEYPTVKITLYVFGNSYLERFYKNAIPKFLSKYLKNACETTSFTSVFCLSVYNFKQFHTIYRRLEEHLMSMFIVYRHRLSKRRT